MPAAGTTSHSINTPGIPLASRRTLYSSAYRKAHRTVPFLSRRDSSSESSGRARSLHQYNETVSGIQLGQPQRTSMFLSSYSPMSRVYIFSSHIYHLNPILRNRGNPNHGNTRVSLPRHCRNLIATWLSATRPMSPWTRPFFIRIAYSFYCYLTTTSQISLQCVTFISKRQHVWFLLSREKNADYFQRKNDPPS